ncbi:MAG: hypothetical protein JW950_06970, partial [Deltaproteobacteria bacterium]|nr:hypothetical protein [Deltaproteobacteria bacterium]
FFRPPFEKGACPFLTCRNLSHILSPSIRTAACNKVSTFRISPLGKEGPMRPTLITFILMALCSLIFQPLVRAEPVFVDSTGKCVMGALDSKKEMPHP